MTAAVAQFKRPAGASLSDDDRKILNERLATLEGQLSPLIEKAQVLRKEAHGSKMKTLERNADSMAQSLQAVRQKLNSLNLGQSQPGPL